MATLEIAEEQIIRGVVNRITYRNAENGYAVIQLSVADVEGLVTLVGSCSSSATQGSHLVARGSFTNHPKFGRQFAAVSITETQPSNAEGLQRYLASGMIKGIGPGTADKVIEAFGTEAVTIICRDPDRVAKLPGVGKKKADLLHKVFAEREATQAVEQFLIENRVSPRLTRRIFEKYGNRALEVISKDPYVLARVLKGVGFQTADRIALNLGLDPESPQRLRAGVAYALERATEDGHCYLEYDELQEKTRSVLELNEDVDVAAFIDELLRGGEIVRRDNAILLDQVDRAEQYIAEFIAERCKPFTALEINPLTAERSLRNAEKSLAVQFSPEQREAVMNAIKYPLSIITGGPGCGKTTIIKALAYLFKEVGKRLLLAAPTGRASQRMAQVCEMPASTIHRLLRFEPKTGGFKYGAEDQLIADAVIIDESSMMDIHLAKSLFAAIPKNASLILVGDRDQLPSVGPGRVFGDLVSLREIKIASLSQLFRRSEGSSINYIAHLVNCGTMPQIPEPDGATKTDAYFLPRVEPEEAAQLVEKLISDQLPKKFNFAPQDITVLTPSNRGPLGTQALNKRLQNRLNPKGSIDLEQELEVGDITLRVNDRVCQRVNNYNIDDIGVFNGDTGTVYQVDKKNRSVWVELWDGRLIQYSAEALTQLSLAYAVTVHRSQGSEIPCVVLVLHDSQYTLLERQLIYTAITRAKKLLIIVGSKRALSIACKRMSGHARNTLLAKRIRQKLQGEGV
jgi:exodeoxyribonuclease V alpha subunit